MGVNNQMATGAKQLIFSQLTRTKYDVDIVLKIKVLTFVGPGSELCAPNT